MIINSSILTVIMLFKAVLYLMSSLNPHPQAWEMALQAFSADLFTVCNPVLLVLVSDTVRCMLCSFVRGRRFTNSIIVC